MSETQTVVHIDSEEVEKAFVDCLYRDEELTSTEPPKDMAVVKGIVQNVGFHPGRLESHREQVKQWLERLPKEFRSSGGGGWSFLNACNEEDGYQWTSLHQRMEQLFMLGIGLKLAKWNVEDRKLWTAFPGGMPYVAVEV